MKVPGINPVVYQSAPPPRPIPSGVWFPTTQLLDWGTWLVDMEQWPDVYDLLGRLSTHKFHGFVEQMRQQYLYGCYFEQQGSEDDAFTAYANALELALTLDELKPNVYLDSIVALAASAASVLHDKQKFGNAYEFFGLAYDAWRTSVTALPTKSVETNVSLLYYLGRDLWLEGSFDYAHAHIATLVSQAQAVAVAARSHTLKLTLAHGYWMLGLVSRCESDRLDGDPKFLRSAMQRLTEALGLYNEAGPEAMNRARFHVQMGEVHLDMGEWELSEGHTERASEERKQATYHAQQARTFFAEAGDWAGELMARLVMIRHDIMWFPEAASARRAKQTERALQEAERGYTRLGDMVGVAKVATVRAEWMLRLGKPEEAQKALTQALAHFQLAGAGMATRAERLQRLLNASPIRSQRNPGPHFVDPTAPRDDSGDDKTWN